VTRLIPEFDSVGFECVPRAENKIADKLAKAASEGKDEGLVPHSIKRTG
jgi:hypothetical protein